MRIGNAIHLGHNKAKLMLLSYYLDFVCIRQNAFLAKLADAKYICPKLGNAKFTNVQRVCDRLSQFELEHVIYAGNQSKLETLFRIFCFVQFKTENFWRILGHIDLQSFDKYAFVAKLSNAKCIFTSAYIVPGKKGEPKIQTVANRLEAFRDLSQALDSASDMQEIFCILKQIDGIGNFLASQTCFDFAWHNSASKLGELNAFGPGAERGIAKLGIADKNILSTLQDTILNCKDFRKLNVALSLADVQNTLCEFDKWCRIILPTLSIGPAKIKCKYKPGNPFKPKYMANGVWQLIKEV